MKRINIVVSNFILVKVLDSTNTETWYEGMTAGDLIKNNFPSGSKVFEEGQSYPLDEDDELERGVYM